MANILGWGENEPQIKAKDQGGDSISSFATKIKAAISDLFDTLNPLGLDAISQAWHDNDFAAVISGTWTPVLYGDTTEGALTYLGQTGIYKKIGPICFVFFRVDLSGYTTLPAGKVRIKGLPYVANNNSSAYNFGVTLGPGPGAYQKLRAGVIRDSFMALRAVDANNFQVIDDSSWGTNLSDTGGTKIFPTTGTILGAGYYVTA